MASALLSISPFLPLQSEQFQGSHPRILEREVGGLGRNFRSSFYGKVMYNRNCLRMKAESSQGRPAVVASVLGRRVKNKETVIPDPDYRIPVVLLGLAGGLAYTDNLLPAAPICLLGLLLLFQTTRVRFVFDEEALEVRVGERLQNSGENVFVGGKNLWNYSTFVNWELWWPNFPILVYYKETQTKPDGQVHFFPVIFLSNISMRLIVGPTYSKYLSLDSISSAI